MKTDNDDPDIQVPVSQDLRDACGRRLVREDIFTDIANAEDDAEATAMAREIMNDFSLIYCWGYRQGMFRFHPSDGGDDEDVEALINYMENQLREQKKWYTTADNSVTRKEPTSLTKQTNASRSGTFWLLIIMTLAFTLIAPLIGIPILFLLIIFRKHVK